MYTTEPGKAAVVMEATRSRRRVFVWSPFGFVGQRIAVRKFLGLADGAEQLGEACPSLLITGPLGNGKSLFSRCAATHLRGNVHEFVAGTTLNAHDLCHKLHESVKPGDAVIIEEAHGLRADIVKILISALDHRKAPQCHRGKVVWTELHSIGEITVIVVTNRPGSLESALGSRLEEIELGRYSQRELAVIAHRVAATHAVTLGRKAVSPLLKAAQGVPRFLERYIRNMRLYNPQKSRLDKAEVIDLRRREGIQVVKVSGAAKSAEWWLRVGQRDYLKMLHARPLGVRQLAARLHTDVNTVLQREFYLIDTHLVGLASDSKRELTEQGRRVLQQLLDEEDK